MTVASPVPSPSMVYKPQPPHMGNSWDWSDHGGEYLQGVCQELSEIIGLLLGSSCIP